MIILSIIYALSFSQDEQRRKIQPNSKGKRTIQLDAVYNTKCVRCGTGGHLAKDCFKVWHLIIVS